VAVLLNVAGADGTPISKQRSAVAPGTLSGCRKPGNILAKFTNSYNVLKIEHSNAQAALQSKIVIFLDTQPAQRSHLQASKIT
jgi:hypothetical protein